MDSERSKTPKVEDAETARTDGQTESAEPVRAAEKGKRVAPYFYPNVLLAVPAAILSTSNGFFKPIFLIAASLSIIGIIFAIGSLFADADGDGKKAARRARAARVLFWANFLVLTVPLIFWRLLCELNDRFGLF
ncbi:MAG: hypothetical protein II596_09645 [Thermoguttaceae bacterium]|nr:hypothetical protein [Thermoguttaceae bacterium]